MYKGEEYTMPDAIKTEHPRYKESPDAWQTKVQILMRLPFPALLDEKEDSQAGALIV